MFALGFQFWVSPLAAQLVNDGATNILNAISTNLPGTLTVGSNGPNTSLILSNGATLKTSFGSIGNAYSSTNNRVVVAGANSLWNNAIHLSIGETGSFNTLLITAQGKVENNLGFIGYYPGANHNQAIVRDPDSNWTNIAHLAVGNSGSFNTLLITNGARVENLSGFIGGNADATNNQAIITGTNTVWRNRIALFIGGAASFNKMLIANGGQVFNSGGLIGNNSGVSNNQVIVTDPGSVWQNSDNLQVGPVGSFNTLIVTNQGQVLSSSGYIGSQGPNNQVIVTGDNSIWNNNSNLYVGFAGLGNTLLITNGGQVLNVDGAVGWFRDNNQAIVTGQKSGWSNNGNFSVGAYGSSNMLLIANGGTMHAQNMYVGNVYVNTLSNLLNIAEGILNLTNTNGNAVMEVRRGNVVFNGGTITSDHLLMNNTGGSFSFNAGTLKLQTASVANGSIFTVGNGVSLATYCLDGADTNTHFFSDGLFISSGAMIIGHGTVGGTLIVSPGARLAPGGQNGAVTLSNSPSLQGVVEMDLSKANAMTTNDTLRVIPTLIYGGTLIVNKLGPVALEVGDKFKLFSAGSFSGAFNSISLPLLASGLAWTNKLLSDGSIEVVASPGPKIETVSVIGTKLVYAISSGTPGGSYMVLTTTNVALPLTNWSVATNDTFDWLGNSNFTNALNPSIPSSFFKLFVP